MASWRDAILARFPSGIARLSVVADPDQLLLDERIFQELRQRGFEVRSFEDPIAFRFDYESRYRSRWDRGEPTDLAVIVRTSAPDVTALPYDLLAAGRRLAFTLAGLFPTLSPSVLAAPEHHDLDPLYEARQNLGPTPRGETGTRDLVLRHVFGVDVALLRNPADVLALLLRLHATGRDLPTVVAERLLQVLRSRADLADWPLEQIVTSRDALYAFLEERWPIFLERLASGRSTLGESAAARPLAFPGPALLPLDDTRVRPLVSALFLEGALRPVEPPDAAVPAWAAVGIRRDPASDRWRRLKGLIDQLGQAVPAADARYGDWLAFAARWAELNHLRWSGPGALAYGLDRPDAELRSRVDRSFVAWIERRYGGLYNQPAIPVMVHHIPRALAQYRARAGSARIALLVLDGLALDQWITLRKALSGQRPEVRFHERAVFAWVPTITSVSRQAIFAGQPPARFAPSISTTAHEATLWSRFWADEGLAPTAVGYKLLPPADAPALAAVDELLGAPRLEVLGLVVRVVDQMVHGTPLGMTGVHAQIRLWTQSGFPAALVDRLLDRGFSVFLTADHGNIEAVGIGGPAEGALAETRGERVRVYSDERLRQLVKARYPGSIAWPPLGLPDDYLPLLAPGRAAFVGKGEITVAHGGISVEEVVVPFVRVERGT